MDVCILTKFINNAMWCWMDDHPRRMCNRNKQPQTSQFPPTKQQQMRIQPKWWVRFLQENFLHGACTTMLTGLDALIQHSCPRQEGGVEQCSRTCENKILTWLITFQNSILHPLPLQQAWPNNCGTGTKSTRMNWILHLLWQAILTDLSYYCSWTLCLSNHLP